ncbi:MAG: hypothetical protein JSS87_03690 [Acidobacteria bacterium]|nr:hypothetical protein [Acidobacteriota bacterium]
MSFAIYLIGYLVLIAGVSYGLHLAHVSQHWIVVADLILIGLAIATGVRSTRHKDPA